MRKVKTTHRAGSGKKLPKSYNRPMSSKRKIAEHSTHGKGSKR